MYQQYRCEIMANSRQEVTLKVDWEIIDASKGYAIDIGASAVNIIYVSQEDWVEPNKRQKSSKGCLRVTAFSRMQIDEAFTLINNKAKIARKSPDEIVEIYTTGMGGPPYSRKISEALKAKNTNVTEFDSFKEAFMYLVKSLPRSEILHPIHRPAFEAIEQEVQGTLAMVSQMEGMTEAFGSLNTDTDFTYAQMSPVRQDRPLSEDPDLFPCGMMMCGSACGFSVMNADGSYSVTDGSYRAGKFFLGLGSLLTGARSYAELMALAVKGDSKNVNITNRSVMDDFPKSGEDEQQDNMYAMDNGVDDSLLYTFGKADGKSIADFKKEDIARGLLETVIQDLAQTTYYIARDMGLKHIFFSGGFVNHPLVREYLTLQWLRRDFIARMFNPTGKGKPMIQAHFLIHAAGLGAIGAMLNYKMKWSEKNQQA